MLNAPRCNSRVVAALMLLLIATLVTVSLDQGHLGDDAASRSPGILDAPELTIRLVRDEIAVIGTTRSLDHEALIAQVIADRFPDRDVREEFSAGLLLPEDWEPVSIRLLYVLSAMESATATMTRGRIELRGVTAEADAFRQRLAFLRDAVSPGTTLFEDVFFVDDRLALNDLCRRSFVELGALPVAFAESSTELRESAYPSLDKLIDFAWDCSDATIVITGHTDATGNESWNQQLSRARAQAVADYLNENGVASERLVVEGRGSTEPIADNDTRYGRGQNRRIEFALRAPLL